MKTKIYGCLIICLAVIISSALLLTSCEVSSTYQNVNDTKTVTEQLTKNQQTPTDIEYSLERYNLIKRAYWVNGQREQALEVQCPIKKPIGYIALFGTNGNLIATYEVDGKVTSLNSYLSPDSDYYTSSSYAHWLADVDGSYGTNVDGVFWFTTDNHYMEWTGTYLYSDVPFNFSNN